jgi:D-lactate dehydrogenase (cytochrome)
MNEIVSFRPEDMDITVQPGISWTDLNAFLKPYGMFLPIDPGPGAHIGGMVATNASGTNAVRYGTMKDWVLNLTVVLPAGYVLRTRSRARKSSTGYDLTRLFCGSEGTLGIISEVTLKLAPLPEKELVGAMAFNSTLVYKMPLLVNGRTRQKPPRSYSPRASSQVASNSSTQLASPL